MEESKEIRNMRNMAWERVKGELKSISHTFWNNESFTAYEDLMYKFIQTVQAKGLIE